MKLESFKSGRRQQRDRYKSFEPVPVNHAWHWEDATINTLLEQAMGALGELNAFSLIVPDIDLFIKMHVLKEAQKSSMIEGTQTGFDEAAMDEALIRPERRDDWHEVQNYVQALNTAIELQQSSLPLSNRLLKRAHAILMQGVRGERKQPGKFRTSQNWIGGSNLKDAAYIPPHPESVPDLMSDLEKFWHNEQIMVPHLIRIAISHYQFETIHPFLDGNGRIGRLMIPLYLIHHGLLAKPSLYLSDFFERNRTSYFDALAQARESNDLIHWTRFFLSGVAEIATTGKETFRQILDLRSETDEKILTLGKRSKLARDALKLLYRDPTTTAKDLEIALKISRPATNNLIKSLIELDILKESTGQQRWRVYVFETYLNLFVR